MELLEIKDEDIRRILERGKRWPDEYLKYLSGIVSDEISGDLWDKYSTLFYYMMGMDYYSDIPMDDNRSAAGVTMRRYFAYDKPRIAGRRAVSERMEALSGEACSIFELMVSLSQMCFDKYLSGYEEDHLSPSTIFMSMMKNLDILEYENGIFDVKNHVKNLELFLKFEVFLHKKYSRDGKGGLFYVKNAPDDMRNLELFWQMEFWLQAFYPVK